MTDLKAPFPWFGGKSRVADLVWDRFGNVDNYVEPFFGSGAILLSRPHEERGTETVNDLDCYLANFWRALTADALELAAYCDHPVNEADLHARHLWLVQQEEFRHKVRTDPFYFDIRVAGWWVWGLSQWIGSGWCSRPEWSGRTNAARISGRGINADRVALQIPRLSGDQGINRRGSGKRPMIHGGHTGKGVHKEELSTWQQVPDLGAEGKGVHRGELQSVTQKLPSLGDAGRGIHSEGVNEDDYRRHMFNPVWQARPFLTTDGQGVHAKRPHLSGRGNGVGVHGDEVLSGLYGYFQALHQRMRRVRVCCGDWKRVTGPSVTVKHGVCGIFLDPPYDMRVVSDQASGRDGAAPSDGLYATHDNDVSREVREWAIEQGENPLLRIAVCGYEGEHQFPESWECVAWKSTGGYGSQRKKRAKQQAASDHRPRFGEAPPGENADRERIWFSPACLRGGPLFHS